MKFISLLSLALLELQTATSPTTEERPAPRITFTNVPQADPGGPDATALLEGRIEGECDGCFIALFSKSSENVWYVQPTVKDFKTPIRQQTWSNEIHLGLQFAAVAAVEGFQPAAKSSNLPSPGGFVKAVAVVDGK